MKVDVLTLHPNMFSPLQISIVGRAKTTGLVDINIHNIRDFGVGKYKQVDDTPYGGGSGMVMRVDVVNDAIQSLRSPTSKVLLMDPTGIPFQQNHARSLTTEQHLIFVCGHYEGIDSRIRDHFVDEVYSIGDYILTGGELPAMVIIDSVIRLLPGVLGNSSSLEDESFNAGLLEAPVYTRPREYQGHTVPDVLMSGHHENIRKFRIQAANQLTSQQRPDLLKQSSLDKSGTKE
jgi:tRNA (guanine37-N1)-methyltransferase